MENSHQYKSFEKAREYVRGLGLKLNSDWKSCSESGEKSEDNSTNDCKDQGQVSRGDAYMPFEKARQFIRNLNLKSTAESAKKIIATKSASELRDIGLGALTINEEALA